MLICSKFAILPNCPYCAKDFTVDAYMIYEAKVIGADAVLLICSLLEKETLRQYLRLCRQLD